MSNLEHLIENGLCRLSEGKTHKEWCEIMQQDCNWKGNENITIDNLWEICQYVFSWDSERTFVRCKDCKYYMTIHCTCDGCCISDDWYCADGERQ